MNKDLIKIINLNIGFQEILIKDFSTTIESGKIIALMGKNGKGKSCLIKTIAQFIPTLQGEILLNNVNISDYSSEEFARNISIMLTEKIQTEYLSVYDLVKLARSPFTSWSGKLTEGDIEIVDNSLSLLGIVFLKDKFFHELSDGQKQKVLLARAIAQSPKLLILDEPTTYLDIPSRVEFYDSLKKISEKNIAILLSTHDFSFLNKIVDTVWLISENKIIIGNPEELKSSGSFYKEFGLNLN